MTREFNIRPVPLAVRAVDLIGGVVIVGALVAYAWSIRASGFTTFQIALYVMLLSLMAMPVAAAVWPLFRMGVFAARIADPVWRESLAVTPGSARDWLDPTMQKRLGSALLPIWISAIVEFVWSAAMFAQPVPDARFPQALTEFIVNACVFLVPVLILHAIAGRLVVGASHNMLARLCRAHFPAQAPVWLPFEWMIRLAVPLVAGTAVVLWIATRIDGDIGLILPYIYWAILFRWSNRWIERSKADAVRAYYELDLSALSPPKDQAAPKPSRERPV